MNAAGTIVITEPEYRKAKAVFDEVRDMGVAVSAPAEDEVARQVCATGATAVILGVETYTGALYEALPRGGAVSRFGVGHDGVDKVQASVHGLVVTNTPGVLEDAVAEHTLALMLGLARNLRQHCDAMAARRWSPSLGWELRGRTLGVLGCGAIGRRVARLATGAFGMQAVGHDVDFGATAELLGRWGFDELCSDLLETVSQVDVVSVHLPAGEATRGMIGADVFDAMKPTAVVINTARGMVLDEAALYDALSSGSIAAAALDVFESEPYVPVAPARDLRELPNVLLTPHVSSSTVEACERMARAALNNIRLVRSGQYDRAPILNPDVVSGLTS